MDRIPIWITGVCLALAVGVASAQVVDSPVLVMAGADTRAQDPAVNTADAPEVRGGVGILTVSPTLVDFGTVAIPNSSTPRLVTLANTGTAALVINALTPPTPPFALAAGGTCGAAPITIVAGSSCTFNYVFVPFTTGLFQQVLGFSVGGGNNPSVTLQGISLGAPPGILSITPTTLDLGNVVLGNTSQTLTVTLSNVSLGPTPVVVDALTPAAAPFAMAAGGTCSAPPITIFFGSACTLVYTFTPTAPGAAAQVLAVTVNPGGFGSGTITLQGNGIAAPTGTLALSTPTLAFGNQIVGAGAVRTLEVRNSGAGSLTVTSITAPAAPFAVAAGGNCAAMPFVLAAATSCTIHYRYQPTTAGPSIQVLTVTSDGGSAALTLSGTGMVATALDALGAAGGLLLLLLAATLGAGLLRRHS